jgi:hypothetical protein
MKTELSKIAKDLEQGTITDNEARNLLLGLLGVSVSVLSDSEIEALAEEVYKEVSKTFPIYAEYEFTQGYIVGAMAMRNRLRTER